jgi:pyruvate/2-oxoglutarate/acetoin dehydrogenase E1 component
VDMSYAKALNTALLEEMRADPSVVFFGEDVGVHGGAFGVSRGLIEEFGPDRVRDTPISEATIAGTAVGAALIGLRPVAEIMFIDFASLAMDQICNQAAKLRYMTGGKARVPLVIRSEGGGGRGNAAQHSQSLEAWFAHMPGLKVVMPSTPNDAYGLLRSAIRDDDPVIFIEHKVLYSERGPVEQGRSIPLGTAEVKREGRDVTVIATSRMVVRALAVAESLSQEGIEVEVVDPRTLSPLDSPTLVASARKTGRVIVAHEAPTFGGFGGEIVAQIVEHAWADLHCAPRRVGAAWAPVPYALGLENAVLPQESDVEGAIRAVLSTIAS